MFIAMLTAKGREIDRSRGLAVGADLYMSKPFRPDEVMNIAKSVLDI